MLFVAHKSLYVVLGVVEAAGVEPASLWSKSLIFRHLF